MWKNVEEDISHNNKKKNELKILNNTDRKIVIKQKTNSNELRDINDRNCHFQIVLVIE
jgi:hypothetical protein